MESCKMAEYLLHTEYHELDKDNVIVKQNEHVTFDNLYDAIHYLQRGYNKGTEYVNIEIRYNKNLFDFYQDD